MSRAATTSEGGRNVATATPSTRDRLINVGLGLMRQRGYGATGLQEILTEADIPKGSFYHHFSSKEEFAAQIVLRYGALVGEHCQAMLGNNRRPPLRRLRLYFEELIRRVGQSAPVHGCLIGALSLEIADESPVIQRQLSAGFAEWQRSVAEVLREAAEKGEIKSSLDFNTTAAFILNSWEGALLRSQADRSDEPLEAFLYFVFEKLLKTL